MYISKVVSNGLRSDHYKMGSIEAKSGPTYVKQNILAFCQEKLKGEAKDNRPLIFKTIGYCLYCSFYRF